MMYTVKLDLDMGAVYFNSAPIEVREKDILVGSTAVLCTPRIDTKQGRSRCRLSEKVSVFGQSAVGVIEVADGRVYSVTFLFDLMEFFESSILESKIIKTCERSLNSRFKSDHPSTAFLDCCKWGSVMFFYDAKQGDLSLEIKLEGGKISDHAKKSELLLVWIEMLQQFTAASTP